MSIYNDDEPIRKQNSTEEEASLELDGNTEARIINKQEAPLEESPFKVLLELKGVGSGEGRLGVDLVTILDVSGSMQGTKIAKMQLAMQFLVQKLGRFDRLSVVTFNRKADRRCPLRQMTEDSRTKITDDVNGLVAEGSTNTEAGLKMALKILNERTLSKQRRSAIMLMSDGIEDYESDAANVPVGDVPVYTFGFGSDCEGEVLRAIAKNGGTYADVVELDKLNVAFSMSLAGLLNVVIEDLDLTITLDKGAKFTAVNAGNYQQNKGSTDVEPVTVKFGSLYDREIRKVLVDLTLPEVENRLGANYFTISYRYRVVGKDTYKTNKITSNVTRVAGSSDAEREEVLAEEKRIGTASSMKEARVLADAKKLEEARKKMQDVKTKLSVKEVDAILRAQLDQLLVFMVSQETYDKHGRAFALAVEASHDSQRAQPLPNADPSKVGMFTTPLMDLFMEQAMLFDQNPTGYRVPTEEEDKVILDKEEDKKVILNKLEMAVKVINDMATAIKGMSMPGIGKPGISFAHPRLWGGHITSPPSSSISYLPLLFSPSPLSLSLTNQISTHYQPPLLHSTPSVDHRPPLSLTPQPMPPNLFAPPPPPPPSSQWKTPTPTMTLNPQPCPPLPPLFMIRTRNRNRIGLLDIITRVFTIGLRPLC